MNWPKRIRLGYRTVRVKRARPHSIALNSNLGAQRNDSGELLFADGLDSQAEANIILHEMIHSSLKLAGHDGMEGEERIVGAIANGLCQSMQDNSKLWRKLVEALT